MLLGWDSNPRPFVIGPVYTLGNDSKNKFKNELTWYEVHKAASDSIMNFEKRLK